MVKAVAERDLLRVIHMHRKNKAAFSDRFPGCDQQNLLAEEASFSRLSQEVGHITMGDCGSLFEKVATMRAGGSQGVLHPTSPVSSPPRCFFDIYPHCDLLISSPMRPPSPLSIYLSSLSTHISTLSLVQLYFPYPQVRAAAVAIARRYPVDGAMIVDAGDSGTESMLLQLQAAVMEGRSGLNRYLQTVFVHLLQHPAEQNFPGCSRVLRVYCHLALWLFYSAPVMHPLSFRPSHIVFDTSNN